MRSREHGSGSQGFTLIELMIVIVVLATLVTIALPSYQNYVIRTNRSAAKAALLQVAARQEQYFGDNKTYAADDMTVLGYAASELDIDNQGQPASGSDVVYHVTIIPQDEDRNEDDTAPVLFYTIQAEPQGRQTKDTACGTLSLTENGQRAVTGTQTVTDCWR